MGTLGVWPDDFTMRKVGTAGNMAMNTPTLSGASALNTSIFRAAFQINAITTDYWEGDFWTASGDCWFTVSLATNATSQAAPASTTDQSAVELRNSGGTAVIRLRRTVSVLGDGTANINKITCEYWTGSAWTALSGFVLTGSNEAKRFTLRCKIDASAGEFAWYADGVLQGSTTGDTTGSGASTVDRVRLKQPVNANVIWYYWEIAAHTDDLRFARVGTFVGNAAPAGGDGTAWTGDYTAINEQTLNEATVISTTAAGDVEAWNAADKASLLTGLTVLDVGLATWGRKGATGPANLELGVYQSSTLYTSGNVAGLTTAYGIQHYEWPSNPATSAAWTLAEVDGVRWAVKSAT